MTAKADLSALPPGRRLIDAVTRRLVAFGGAAVIGTITLIFVYLLWVVAPMFSAAQIGSGISHPLSPGESALIDINQSSELLLRLVTDGRVEFIDLDSGSVVNSLLLETSVREAKRVAPQSSLYAFIDDSNRLGVYRASYPISFIDGRRFIDSQLSNEYAGDWTPLGDFVDYDVYLQSYQLTVATIEGQELVLREYPNAERGFPFNTPVVRRITLDRSYSRVILGSQLSWLYLIADDGAVSVLDLRSSRTPKEIYSGNLTASDTTLTAVEPLLGRFSLLTADSSGEISQWFMVRTESARVLEKIRSFSTAAPATLLIPELRRKGFAAFSGDGQLSLYYTTSNRLLAARNASAGTPSTATISPRAELLASVSTDDTLTVYPLDNKHPEISFSALWAKIWYEGYDTPVYSWQSSSADNDFEEKFSLSPLLFGTVKAAAYAMLFAIPTAIMAAIYTAFFMAPAMRRLVKPGIEIIAAFPTVVLGFLAGLWLAPLIEAQLATILTAIILLPVMFIVTSALWQLLPDPQRNRFQGWQALLALPVVLITLFAAVTAGPFIERTLFSGSLTAWMQLTHGIDYDQRNALVVGMAMGLAVIPTIFSIAEDAIYSVPRHLINGSLALGATRWQTMTRVVLLTASPGIFSAVIIGLGRSLGETMIVLMATGNTAIMDWNIFEGMRTFAANIAVELPESEVGSSHYRILFLASLVLFALTFFLNSLAELVRQRLRERYGNL